MRCEGADVRAEAVPVLLALRAGGGTVPGEGGLHGSRGGRSRSRRSPASDGGISREGGAGARTATRENRADAGPPSDRPRVGTAQVEPSDDSSNTGPTASSRVPQMPAAVRRAFSLSLVLLLLVAGSLVVLVPAPPASAAGHISVYMAGL